MVFLPGKARCHEDGGLALIPALWQQAGREALKRNAIGNGQAFVWRKAALDEGRAHPFGHADAGLGMGLERQRLAQPRGRVALARVVLHVKDARHMLGHGGAAAPDMVAEAMGKDHVGPPVADDAAQLPHRDGVQPVGYAPHLQPLIAQRLDTRGRGVALAPQHQQGLHAGLGLRGQAQIDRHLRGAGEAPGHKVQDPHRPRQRLDSWGRRTSAAWRSSRLNARP